MVSESPWSNPVVRRRYPRWHLCNLSTSSDQWRLKVCGEALCLLGFSGKQESWLQVSVPRVGNGFKQHSSLFYVILLHFEKLKAKNRVVQSARAGRAVPTRNMATQVWAPAGSQAPTHLTILFPCSAPPHSAHCNICSSGSCLKHVLFSSKRKHTFLSCHSQPSPLAHPGRPSQHPQPSGWAWRASHASLLPLLWSFLWFLQSFGSLSRS